MQWYSTTAWENHTAKHHKDNLAIYLDEPEFGKKFKPHSSKYASPGALKQLLPHEREIMNQVQAAKYFFRKNNKLHLLLWFPRKRV